MRADLSMKKGFDILTVYDYTDDEIVQQLCRKVKAVRLSCCFSQQEFADQCGISVITVKRIESGVVKDITIGTLLKIMRVSGTLEGVVKLIPDLPKSPFLYNEKTGKQIQRFNSKRKIMS